MNTKEAHYSRLVIAFIILLVLCVWDNRASASTLHTASSQAAETAPDQQNKAVNRMGKGS